jgi:hypothetical protein
MAAFPRLKTTAIAQYPAQRAVGYRTSVFRFVDGAEQRYRESAGPLRKWTFDLRRLDETELAAIDDFFAAQRGAAGTFAFTDPWTGREYANCSFERSQLNLHSIAEMNGCTTITVVENRS